VEPEDRPRLISDAGKTQACYATIKREIVASDRLFTLPEERIEAELLRAEQAVAAARAVARLAYVLGLLGAGIGPIVVAYTAWRNVNL
jgi:hypothetical protein